MIRAAAVPLGVHNRVSPHSRAIGPVVRRRAGRCRPRARVRRARPAVPHRAGDRRVARFLADVVRRGRRPVVSRARRPVACRRVGLVSPRNVPAHQLRKQAPVRAGRLRAGRRSRVVPSRLRPTPPRSSPVPAAPRTRHCVRVSPAPTGPCAAVATTSHGHLVRVAPPRPRAPVRVAAPAGRPVVNAAPPQRAALRRVNVAPSQVARVVHPRPPVHATAATVAGATTARVVMVQ